MAVMTLEVLIGGGAKEIVFAGFAGSLVPDINPGDLYFPSSALSTEGTSMHYQPGEMKPDTDLYAKVEKVFSPLGLHRQGVVWSTDGPFRETAELRQSFIQKGASVVEMEVSALLSAASFRKVKLAAVLLITDTFGKGDWYDGFKFPAYKNGLNSLSDNIWNVFR
jgi:uridine phosphorylase